MDQSGSPVAEGPAQPPSRPRPLDLSVMPRPDAVYDLSLLLTIALLLPLGAQIATELLAPASEIPTPTPHTLMVDKAFEALLLLTLAAYFLRRNRLPATAFGLQWTGLGRQVLWAVPTLAGVYTALLATVLVVQTLIVLFPQLAPDLGHRSRFLDFLPIDSFLNTVLLLIPVAIHEELLFRGLLLPYLHRVGLTWAQAIVASTGLFALLHAAQGWLAVVQIFGVGLMFSAFFVLSRSLLAVVLAHFAFNLLQMQLVRLLQPWLERLPGAA